MKVRKNIKAGGNLNHNQAPAKAKGGLRVKSGVKAGSPGNHNEVQVRDA
jgi:hypothetical protein